MNQIKRKEKQFDDNIITQASTSTNFTKRNKMMFYKTISSNFSQEPNKNQKIKTNLKYKNFNSVKKSQKKKNNISPIPNFKSINETPNK